MSRAARVGHLSLLLSTLVVIGACAVACSDSGTVTATDDTFELHVRTPTTIAPVDPEADAAFDAALAAADTSTTFSLGGDTTTSIYTPKSTTTTSSSSSSSTASPDPLASSSTTTSPPTAPAGVPPQVCNLFSQLTNFYVQIKPQIDANDPQGTASRVAGSVQASAKGFDQILDVAPGDIKPAAATVIGWLRDAAAGNPIQADGAEDAAQQIQSWFSDNCK